MHEIYKQVLAEVRSAWRFRWLAMIVAWVLCLGGWAFVVTMPNIYEANARVYVDTSSELRRLLGNQIIDQDVSTQLNFVRQSILGRVQLEQVAAATGLDRRAVTPDERQRVVDDLRSKVRINASGAGSANNSIYSIRYEHPDRDTALAVVTTLLNVLVEDTMGRNWEGSLRTRQFLEEQIADLERRLAEAENRLAQFRRENFDRLPGTQGGYFQRLQAQTEALDNVRRDLDLAQSRRDRILQRLQGEAPMSGADRGVLGDEGPGSLTAQIAEHESRLQDLLLRYTDRHYEVVAIRESLEELRRRRAEELAALTDLESGPILSTNPVYQQLQISLNDVEVEIAALQADVAERQRRVDHLRSLIDEVPEVEAQEAQLNRNYNTLRSEYEQLVQSQERERLSREAHETERVEFEVIDPPVAGFEPVSPNRPVLLVMALMFGVGAGGGTAFLLAQIRPVFQEPRVLRDVTGLPVLGVVSMAWKGRHRVRRRLAVLVYVAGGAGLALMFLGIFAIETFGPGMRAFVRQML